MSANASKKKCLVTGGAGFIGSHLVDRLLADGHEVTVLDNLSTGNLKNLNSASESPDYHFFEENVADFERTRKYYQGVDWVFHLAALADIVPSIERPLDYSQANVQGTFSVLEASRLAHVKRFIYAASSSCYGIPDVYPTPETAPIHCEYPYALSKYLGECAVMQWHQVYKLPCVSLRLLNVYGPRARTTGTYGAVFGVFLAQKIANKPFTIVGDGTQTRDFTYVSDVVEAFMTVVQSELSGDIFNLGSGGTYSINKLVELLGGEKTYIQKRPGEPDCTFADIDKIARVLNWRPKVRFEDGVKIMLEHLKDWSEAPVWDEQSISVATKEWFTYLGSDAKEQTDKGGSSKSVQGDGPGDGPGDDPGKKSPVELTDRDKTVAATLTLDREASGQSSAVARDTERVSTNGTDHKVQDLEGLAEVIARKKADGKKIVHCHGVFDLLHIGHLRHFSEAKKYGHVLVVTLTPDRFVNKGPHKPAFTESLRAEAVAALSCVDYVAVSRWPMAAELIGMLKPDFYVKGSDYKQASDDITGGIDVERQAIEDVGGTIAFTDDLTFSSTSLINRHLSTFSTEVNSYLSDFRNRYSYEDVRKCIESVKDLRVLVVGEAIIDNYSYCDVIGKSGKEPMLAIKQISEEKFGGGILAVGNNISQFIDHVGLVSFIGDDGVLDDFVTSCLKPNIEQYLLKRADSPTIVKKRFIESYFFSKLLSVYTINDRPLSTADNERLCQLLEKTVPEYDLVIVVDFGHSMLTEQAAHIICDKARFLAVNTQSNAGNLGYQTIFKYSKADLVCITENEMRLEARDKVSDPQVIMHKFAEKFQAKRICITQGERGSMGFEQNSDFVKTPALGMKVVDRMGSGDTFMALASLCTARGLPVDLSLFVASAAAAQAVATVGHREPVGRVSLLKFIGSLLKF